VVSGGGEGRGEGDVHILGPLGVGSICMSRSVAVRMLDVEVCKISECVDESAKYSALNVESRISERVDVKVRNSVR